MLLAKPLFCDCRNAPSKQSKTTKPPVSLTLHPPHPPLPSTYLVLPSILPVRTQPPSILIRLPTAVTPFSIIWLSLPFLSILVLFLSFFNPSVQFIVSRPLAEIEGNHQPRASQFESGWIGTSTYFRPLPVNLFPPLDNFNFFFSFPLPTRTRKTKETNDQRKRRKARGKKRDRRKEITLRPAPRLIF